MSEKFRFASGTVQLHSGAAVKWLESVQGIEDFIILTDENVMAAHPWFFKNRKCIVIPAGESGKIQSTADGIIDRLLEMGADRNTLLVGVGGGVITDITGYVASVFMRGIRFGFIPTSLLCMVDASIGGKNGVNVGLYKNMVGTIRQPEWIVQDIFFLNTLPEQEWRNGFAEIIKHATIADADLFSDLKANDISKYRENELELKTLIERNTRLKMEVVQKDEEEKGERKLLNFGHTIGHALENVYALSHGEAISIGMHYASLLSEKLMGFKEAKRVSDLLLQYKLPINHTIDRKVVMDILSKDKKKNNGEMRFVLLEKIGKASLKNLSFTEIESIL